MGRNTHSDGFPASNATDEHFLSGWSPSGDDAQSWWQVDLGAPTQVRRVEVIFRWELDQPDTRRNFQVLGSDDPSFATREVLGEWGNTVIPHQGIWTVELQAAKSFRYIRVAKSKPGYFFLSEVRVLSPG